MREALDSVPACVCSLGGAAFPGRAAGEPPGELQAPSWLCPAAPRGWGHSSRGGRLSPGAGSAGVRPGRGPPPARAAPSELQVRRARPL